MFLYRITNKKYAADLSGAGAKQYGGRWNSVGKAVIYTSTSVSLATLEFLCHTAGTLIPKNFVIIKLESSDSITSAEIKVTTLPSDWRQYPAPIQLQIIGNKWLDKSERLLLKVPSVIIPIENNILINPFHKEISKIKIVEISDFTIDDRIIENVKK